MTSRKMFCQLLKEARRDNARRLWHKAETASRLRHLVRAQGFWRSGRRLGAVKFRTVRRVCEIAPEFVRAGVDGWRYPGLLSVRFAKAGALHVRAGAEMYVLAALRFSSVPQA